MKTHKEASAYNIRLHLTFSLNGNKLNAKHASVYKYIIHALLSVDHHIQIRIYFTFESHGRKIIEMT